MELSTWRTGAGDFDVLADMPDRTGRGRGYSELVGQATNKDFAGTTVIVAALDDVIDSKRWANRPKDQAALLELDALAAERHVGFDSSAIEIVDLAAGDDLER